MSRLTRQTAALPEQERLPERILQFGDGNFLRGFADDFVDRMNREADFNSGVVIVPPASTGKTPRINRQDGLYHLFLRGRQDGHTVDERRLIGCVTRAMDVYDQWEELLAFVCRKELRFVISNTTEAGICYVPDCRFDDAPPSSFPAKVTRLLWQRWHAGEGGLIFLPLVRMVVTDEFYRQSCPFRRKFPRHGIVTLDNPQAEGLRCVHQRVLQPRFRLQLFCQLGGIARYDPIHQRVTECILLPDPADKCLLQCPVTGMAQDHLSQGLSVIRDQLAGQEN